MDAGTPADPRPLQGLRVAVTGRLASMTRERCRELILAAGGLPRAEVSARTGVLVVGMHGWPLMHDGRVTAKLRRAELLHASGAAIEIISEDAFLERVGLRPRREALRKQHTAASVCGLLGIEESVLRRWGQLGLVRPEGGMYDFQDLVSLRTLADLVRRGVSVAVIQRSLASLGSILPGSERPLAQLRIIAEGPDRLLAEVGESLLSPDGQLLMRFEGGGGERETLSLPAAAGARSVDRLLEGACGSAGGRAEELCRRAIDIDPTCAEAQFNLGNVLLESGRLEAALERFGQATALDPEMACAWYNLGYVQEELGMLEGARASLSRVLALEPAHADAHFNLAAVCAALGLEAEARRLWAAYLRLDGTSEWAAAARECLGG